MNPNHKKKRQRHKKEKNFPVKNILFQMRLTYQKYKHAICILYVSKLEKCLFINLSYYHLEFRENMTK